MYHKSNDQYSCIWGITYFKTLAWKASWEVTTLQLNSHNYISLIFNTNQDKLKWYIGKEQNISNWCATIKEEIVCNKDAPALAPCLLPLLEPSAVSLSRKQTQKQKTQAQTHTHTKTQTQR